MEASVRARLLPLAAFCKTEASLWVNDKADAGISEALHRRTTPLGVAVPERGQRGQTCALKAEGLVSKQATASYASGNRGIWIKTKCLNRQEFVIVGWTEPEGSRPYLGSLLLG